MRAPLWAAELTLTTRGDGARFRAGRSNSVRRKLPRKLVSHVRSIPSAVTSRRAVATPALLTRTSSVECDDSHRVAASRIDWKDARSITRSSALWPLARIASTTAWPRVASRAAMTTSAPSWARARAVSRPMPPLAPVIMIVFMPTVYTVALGNRWAGAEEISVAVRGVDAGDGWPELVVARPGRGECGALA